MIMIIIIEFCAFLHLRRVKPDMHRPYKIGLGLIPMSIFLSFPMMFIVIIIYFSSLQSILLSLCCVCLGIVVYYGLSIAKFRGWMEFEGTDHDHILGDAEY